MSKKIRIGNAILCEYVAPGSYNKNVLVNVYSGDIIVQSLPATVMFGLYVEVHNPGEGIFAPQVQVRLGGKALFKAGMSFGLTKDANIVVQSFPVHIEKDSVLEIFVSMAGFQTAKAISKTITVGAIPGFVPSALPPPDGPPQIDVPET